MLKISEPPKWKVLLQILEEIKINCKLDKMSSEKGTLLFSVIKAIFI